MSVVAMAVVVGLAACTEAGPTCTPSPEHPEWSAARQWNEVLLDAIRRDLPAPTVHARNLFHTSAAMWDAWAAFDDDATGVFVNEDHTSIDSPGARDTAISYAAYRILEARYLDSIGATDTIPQLDATMASLCLPIDVTSTEGDAPAQIGNRIASTIIAAGLVDGSNEANGYAADYAPVNPPLVVSASGTELVDPDRWQPLEIQNMVSQNGILLDSGVQEFIDPHWGFVSSFALPPAPANGMPIDPGPPPLHDDPSTRDAYATDAVEIIAYSRTLDPTGAPTIDTSPASLGNNALGTNDGDGYAMNPATGQPYEPRMTNRGDFGRAIAEFWADGPKSETPPGHWNTLANDVSDLLGEDLLIGGRGAPVDRLEWDVKMYLALNGANHDAAVAAWGTKGHYDYIRPISMIRWMGGNGQSTDPNGPSYSEDGLPLVEGIVEVITDESAVDGERHAHLGAHVGEIAVMAYAGNPADPESDIGGVDWILAIDWVPYQSPTFVTPSFAGYVSGHSTFSRASAEVLTAITGDAYFPGGFGQWIIRADSLEFEAGPDSDVVLEWATYRDAADQAGISRLYGGIHVRSDDFAGRLMGAEIGGLAWEKALEYFGTGP